ncbi:hypothetical protein SAMN04487928_11835 [Butyrivibrio proteoclasticus]|uniref:Dolichyl-phosphate-mannose-protein mannosyltransferase n=1 Tax=Butyrivibrio proteoclasticus TaxID=43305 RepID=A0A1I5VNP7_9FIRM|nr:hypothetical protein [Butyrivibrio proteoclasticus]SFQ09109.1 hypothetical protein SAMN04487928_11835 [Butyrivibrio proteoclasticus]
MKTKRKMEINTVIARIITAILAVVFLALLFVFIDANIFHYTARMEADIASETLLGAVIYDNGFIQPSTWYASTAVRVISVPNVAAFIYPLVAHNANLAAGISCVIMMILLLAVMVLYFWQIGFAPVQILSVLVIVMSLTNSADEFQRMLFLYASYYVSHAITLFLILIFYNKWLKENKLSWWTVILSLVIAMTNGMQGMHACLFCYIPLIVTEVIRRIVFWAKEEEQNNIFIMIWVFVLFAASYGSTKFFGSNNFGAGRNIRHAFEKFIGEVCPTIANALSFNRLPVLAILIVTASIAGYVICVYKLIKNAGNTFDEDIFRNYKAALSDDKLDSSDHTYRFWSLLVFPFGFILCTLLETFTTADVAGRYFLMLLFTVGTGFALLSHQLKEKIRDFALVRGIILTALLLVVSFYGVFSAFVFYSELIRDDSSFDTDAYKAYNWMAENGYSYGYTTFDYANYITVMGNNTVKVRAVNNMADMAGCKWLSDTTWYPPVKSQEGATCYIVSEAMSEDFNVFLENYEPEILGTAEVGKFIIYVLDHDYTLWER